MKEKTSQIRVLRGISRWALASSLVVAGVWGCSTTEMSPPTQLPAVPPPYVQAPHPGGYTIGDLGAIFATAGAPRIDDLRDCDADFKKLKLATISLTEIVEGGRELIKRDPVKYHWCFYGKILQLETDLKSQNYLDEKQKTVLAAYGTLTPMARAFMQEFHDSRYLRWAVKHYRAISEWVFYRKVEMTPQTTSELVEAANPFGMLRNPANNTPVLEKYGIAPPEGPKTAESPGPESPGAPPKAPAMPVVEPPAPQAEQPAPPLPPDNASPGSDRAPASAWDTPHSGPPPFPDNRSFPAMDPAVDPSAPMPAAKGAAPSAPAAAKPAPASVPQSK